MADRELRELERRAAAGDAQAAEELRAARARAVVSACCELPHRGPDWRCMTVEEALMARHLAGCTFPIASFDKRFSRSMGALAEAGEITDKQAALLRVKVIRYRRQIPADVVAVAQIGLTQSEPPPA